MNKIEFLSQYHRIMLEIEKKQRYIDFCEERSKEPSGPKLDDKPRNPNQANEAPFVRWVFKGIEAKEELETLEQKAKSIKLQIERAINTVQEEELQMILTYRYIDLLTWKEIAKVLYYSDRSVRRKHEQALELIKIDDQ